ncbi:MAG: hypothetical protein CMJ59_15550, partial [Planctomycetaceae bacterium]|nr:hypothetical protein [Planctomycetaceae bacterium]
PEQPHQEEWAIIYIEQQPVGTIHTRIQKIAESGRALVQTSSETVMKLQRMGQLTEVRQFQESIETPDGQLVRFRSEMKNGPSSLVVHGRLAGNQLVSVVESSAGATSQSIAWTPSYRGFFGPDQSLRARPLQPGESRVLQVLFPGLTSVQVVNTTLQAFDFEETDVAAGKKRLLKVISSLELGGQSVGSTLWVDDAGRQWKAEIPGVGLVLRVERQPELAAGAALAVDLSKSSFVPLKGPIERAHQTRRVAYQIQLQTNDPAKAFQHDTRQQVAVVDDHTARVIVDASGAQHALADAETEPRSADRGANALIQCEDPRIVEMATGVVPDEQEPWQVAKALELHVKQSMRRADFSTAFASAAEVAKTLRGDCSEHAVLLTALCRARGIPARVATGLVYILLENRPGFGFHMWTEVWVGDRWIPLDATLGRGGIGAGHLKLTHSNLSNGEEVSAILSVLPVLRQIEIEVLEVAY